MAQLCVRAVAQEQARGRIGQQARPHRLERAAQRQSVRYPSRGGGDLAAAVSTKFAIEDLHGTDRQTRPESGDPNGCPAASPLMRSKVRAYSHQGHGPRADQQAGYISATSDSTPHLRTAAGPYIWVEPSPSSIKAGRSGNRPRGDRARSDCDDGFPPPIWVPNVSSSTRLRSYG